MNRNKQMEVAEIQTDLSNFTDAQLWQIQLGLDVLRRVLVSSIAFQDTFDAGLIQEDGTPLWIN